MTPADLATLREIVEEAGELGASRALAELRELLRAWRDAKKSAVRAAFGWVVRMVLALVLVGIAVKTGFGWPPK